MGEEMERARNRKGIEEGKGKGGKARRERRGSEFSGNERGASLVLGGKRPLATAKIIYNVLYYTAISQIQRFPFVTLINSYVYTLSMKTSSFLSLHLE